MKHKNLTIACLAGLLALVVLTALYAASPGYGGGWFAQESADHVGIYLEDSQILTSDEEAVQVEGSRATILKGGEYKLSGALSDGQIIVDVGDEEQVVLKLDNVVLHCERSAPLWVKNADRVKLSLPEDSVSIFSDGVIYDAPDSTLSYPTACIYSKSDLTIKGKGELHVNAAFRDGIVSTDSLYLKNGVVMVTAPGEGLRGKDDITMVGGLYSVECAETALSSSGFIHIQAGELNIHTPKSAFHAYSSVSVAEGSRVKARCGPMEVQCPGTTSLAYPITEEEGE